MIISEKQIMRLMQIINDYAAILGQSKTESLIEIYNSIRQLLDSITEQQSDEKRVIE